MYETISQQWLDYLEERRVEHVAIEERDGKGLRRRVEESVTQSPEFYVGFSVCLSWRDGEEERDLPGTMSTATMDSAG